MPPRSSPSAPPAFGARRRDAGANAREGGSVILLVLVILMFASIALARFIEKAGVELIVEVHSADQNRLRADAYSALEVTLAVLADFSAIDGALYNQSQGWDRPLEYARYEPRAGTTVNVAFEDESGKLSLPQLNQTTLESLFQGFGLMQHDAERVADALLVWMKAGHTSASYDTDPQVYERATPPYRPPQRSLRSFQELAAIEVAHDYFYDKEGQPTDLWRQFADAVSLYNFEGTNLNAARPTTMAVAGFDGSQSGLVADYLNGKGSRAAGAPPYFKSIDEARALLGPNAPGDNLGTQVRCLRIEVTVGEGQSAFRVSAVVSPQGGATAVGPAVAAQTTGTATSGTPTATASNEDATASKDLKYPFRILEIKEDPDKPIPPPEPAAQ